MNALDHYREGERLLAQAQRTRAEALYDEAIGVNRLLVEQARAHFDAAQTLLAALNTLNVPAEEWEAWAQIALTKPQRGGLARDFEDVAPCFDCETTGRNCAAHGGRPALSKENDR